MDFNEDEYNDELNNNGSSSLNTGKSISNFRDGFKNGMRSPKEDVDKFKQLGKNNANEIRDNKKKNEEEDNKPKGSELGKKDELEKDGLDKDKDKDKDKNKSDKESSDNKENKKDNKDKSKKNGKKKNVISEKLDAARLLSAKIKMYVLIGILAIFCFFIGIILLLLIYDSFTSAISTFFGIKEYDESNDKYESLYGDEELVELTNEELLEKLGGEDPSGQCVGNGNSFTDNLWFLVNPSGNFKDVCQLLRIIQKTIDEYEKKYNIELDYGLIVSTIFYGYDEQAIADYYDDPSNEEFVYSDEHYSVLENLIDNKDSSGKYVFTRFTLLRIIKSHIFEEVYPFFNYSVETETKEVPIKNEYGAKVKDANGNYITETKIAKVVAKCEQTNVEKYWLSLEKYKMFIRFNDDGQDNETNTVSKFSIPGYMSTTSTNSDFLNLFTPTNGSKVLDRELLNDDDDVFLKLVGSGYVYDTNMNSAFESTDEECNGSISLEELTERLKQMCTDPEECEVDLTQAEDGINFFKDREITDIVDTTIYFQKVEDTKSTEEDIFESRSIKYSYLSSDTVGIKSSIAEEGNEASDSLFEYTQGFAYKNFPGLKKANEDDNLPYHNYDEVYTAKNIENIVDEIEDKTDDYNEILDCNPTYGVDSPQDGVISEALFEAMGEYCEEYTSTGLTSFDKMTVDISDCASNYVTTIPFKDYIMGVTYAEIGGNKNEDYVLTQMVAAISYTLNRHGNYTKGSKISMKSGSCDQNWCSVSQGCSRKVPAGTKYGSTYPGVVDGTESRTTCNGQGGYWKCANSTIQSLYSSLYETASKYLLVGGSTGKVFSAGYTASVQNKWKASAEAGLSFKEILSDHYSGATLVDCLDISASVPGYAGGGTVGNAQGSGKEPGASKLTCTGYINNSTPSKYGVQAAQAARNNLGRSIADCSGFVTKMYSSIGKKLNRLSTSSGRGSAAIANAYKTSCVTASNLAPGDLIFMGKKGTNAVTHVAMYIGGPYNGYYIIHTTSGNQTARYVDFNSGWGNYEILQYSRVTD